MNSQVLIGGRKIEDTPQFRTALQEHQNLIREKYEDKIQQLENERQTIQEDKLQVDRYKQLLLKQRDIMIALTNRLNERDENIIILQEEQEAYDRIHKEQDEILQQKITIIQQMEYIIKNQNIQIPEQLQISINQKHIRNEGQLNKLYYDNQDNSQKYKQDETILELKKQISNLLDQLECQKSLVSKIYQQEGNKIHDKLEKHNIQNKENNFNNNNLSYNTNNEIMKNLKNQIDSIILTLSQPNDQDKLQKVAKDLLELQKIIDSNQIMYYNYIK